MPISSLTQQFLAKSTFRCIGPTRGGRVIAVAGDPNDIATFYFGAVAGGVWKTTDAGLTWRNISDAFFKTSSVSDIAVSPSDPNVIYVGMGESTIRIDVSYGDGVYKSTDGGMTWKHCGLADTRHIAKVRIHPKNPDLVYVAALGHAFGPNSERGIYRSKDGGATWQQIFFKSDKAGAIDLTFDPQKVSYEELVRLFFQLHDPTQLNRQGPDYGTQYRSVVFYHSPEQKATAERVRDEFQKLISKKIVTLIEAAPVFYRAEDYHQKYLEKRGMKSCHL